MGSHSEVSGIQSRHVCNEGDRVAELGCMLDPYLRGVWTTNRHQLRSWQIAHSMQHPDKQDNAQAIFVRRQSLCYGHQEDTLHQGGLTEHGHFLSEFRKTVRCYVISFYQQMNLCTIRGCLQVLV